MIKSVLGLGEFTGEFTIDLRQCNEGMSCEEYTTLVVAGLSNVSPEIRDRMNQHATACSYHQSSTFFQSMVGTPTTETIEQAAKNIVKKYTEKKALKNET